MTSRTTAEPRWQRALVTGASGGIGAAFARELAARGVDLVLVARDETKLADLAGELTAAHDITVEIASADLADPAHVDRLERLLDTGPFVDLLVNNAGIGAYGAFHTTDFDTEMRTVAVNIVAPMRLARHALTRMRAQGRGSLITVSSMDGLQPTPYHAVYGASKAFVNSLFGSLAEETRGTAITSTTVMPGYVDTEFTARAGVHDALDGVPRWMVLEPRRVAVDALDAAAAGRSTCVPGAHYKVSAAVLGALPGRLTRRVFAALATQR